MENTLIELKVSKELEDKFKSVVEKQGLTVTEAIRLFLENVIDTGKLPFETEGITRKYSKQELINKIQEAIGDKPLEEVDY